MMNRILIRWLYIFTIWYLPALGSAQSSAQPDHEPSENQDTEVDSAAAPPRTPGKDPVNPSDSDGKETQPVHPTEEKAVSPSETNHKESSNKPPTPTDKPRPSPAQLESGSPTEDNPESGSLSVLETEPERIDTPADTGRKTTPKDTANTSPSRPVHTPSTSLYGQRDDNFAWRNSSFIFDQSISKNTLSKDSQLTYNPTYRQTYGLRPRYYISDTLSLRLNQDLILELTQPDAQGIYYSYTVRNRVFLLDTSIELVESSLLRLSSLNLGLGGRLIIPISDAAHAWGRIIGVGISAKATQYFDDILSGWDLSLKGSYTHQFSSTNVAIVQEELQCTGAVDSEERVSSPQLFCLGGPTLTTDYFSLGLYSDLSITERLIVDAHFAWWWYLADSLADATIETATTKLIIPDRSNTHFRNQTDVSISFGYRFSDWIYCAIGMNTLSSHLNEDGSIRNPLFNSDTLLFLSATLMLDRIYLHLSGQHFTRMPNSNETTTW